MQDGGWLKRQAIQITAQLPENTEDALAVLEHAKALVEGFLRDDQPALERARPIGDVLSFPAASVSSR